jgi:predicted transport protein
MTLDEFFFDNVLPKKLFEAVRQEVEAIGETTIRITKSQIAFRRQRSFAAVWMPEQYLKREAAPLVLSVFTKTQIKSSRWKEVVEPVPGRFTHHLELKDTGDIDEEVISWLQQAWEAAG